MASDNLLLTGIKGLTKAEAEASRKANGTNSLNKIKGKNFLQKYLESFGDPMVKILLAALGINLIFMFKTLDFFEPMGIAFSILIATLISTLSEHGSQAAFEKIQSDSARIKSTVIRDGIAISINADEIVVGDIIKLQSGDKIPADGLIISGNLQVNQSALNGESKEAKKTSCSVNTLFKGNLMAESEVYRGSVIYGGEALMLVKKVGNETFYGNVAKELQSETRESPMTVRLMQLAKTISRIGYTGAILVAVAYIFRIIFMEFGADFSAFAAHYKDLKVLIPEILNIIMLSVTVVVVAVPEGLPMMITVVLSANMKKLLKNNVLVRKMLGIETAGSLNILFTDKTGTLTKGKLDVTEISTGNGLNFKTFNEIKKQPYFSEMFYMSAFYNNGAYFAGTTTREITGGNATDRALLSFIASHQPLKKYPVVSKIPFDSNNKFSAVNIGYPHNITLFKGAPEKLLPLCTHYKDLNGNDVKLIDKTKIYGKIQSMQKNAARVIVMAISSTPLASGLPEELTLLCIISIKDEIRRESFKSVQRLNSAGIRVVMVTGDALNTATAIAKESGIVNSPNDWITDSKELNLLSDEEIIKRLDRLKVVARALPSDKSRLVRLAQQSGLVCGMTGDGVNDAPALKAADVGFALGSGSEVAKEAAGIVILDDNIYSITQAVLFGRTIFKSIRKFVTYQLTVNLCAVGLSILGPFLGIETPVTIMQMLWINMVMDTLGGLAFSGEPTRESYMKELPKKRDEKILNSYMKGQIIWMACYTLLLCLLFLKLPILNNFIRYGEIYLMTGLFALFMFAAIFNSLNARTHNIFLGSYIARNKLFILIMSFVFIIQTLMIYLGGSVFRTAGLTFLELFIILILAFTVVPADLLRKLILKKNNKLTGV